MDFRRASVLGWSLGPVLAASVAVCIVLAATGPRILFALSVVWALAVFMATVFLGIYATLECHRLLEERAPELVSEHRVGSPYWNPTTDRMLRAASDDRVRSDDVLRPALSFLRATRLAPFGLFVGAYLGQLLARIA